MIVNGYHLHSNGILYPPERVEHNEETYSEQGFATLLDMQQKHFWYAGRHRFILQAVKRHLPKGDEQRSAIDLGGGVGGWISYLSSNAPHLFNRIALADSSERALEAASTVVPEEVDRYHVDLMHLQMREVWDAAFLLDVIEHIPDDQRELREVATAVKPGGLIFVTTPAFQAFWSYNDEIAHHQRRYRRIDFQAIAKATGLTLVDARYFMFFLSPLYLMSRLKPSVRSMSTEELRDLVDRQHETPSPLINRALAAAFALETPLGHNIQFPWGTSILGVFKRS